MLHLNLRILFNRKYVSTPNFYYIVFFWLKSISSTYIGKRILQAKQNHVLVWYLYSVMNDDRFSVNHRWANTWSSFYIFEKLSPKMQVINLEMWNKSYLQVMHEAPVQVLVPYVCPAKCQVSLIFWATVKVNLEAHYLSSSSSSLRKKSILCVCWPVRHGLNKEENHDCVNKLHSRSNLIVKSVKS
jgi:hypothetical protein